MASCVRPYFLLVYHSAVFSKTGRKCIFLLKMRRRHSVVLYLTLCKARKPYLHSSWFKQEAQLSQRGRAMPRVVEYLG